MWTTLLCGLVTEGRLGAHLPASSRFRGRGEPTIPLSGDRRLDTACWGYEGSGQLEVNLWILVYFLFHYFSVQTAALSVVIHIFHMTICVAVIYLAPSSLVRLVECYFCCMHLLWRYCFYIANMDIQTWISNYIHSKQWVIITHSCPARQWPHRNQWARPHAKISVDLCWQDKVSIFRHGLIYWYWLGKWRELLRNIKQIRRFWYWLGKWRELLRNIKHIRRFCVG